MGLSRIVSLLVAVLYVIALVCILGSGPQHDGPARKEHFENLYYSAGGMLLWLALCLGCIWWGDELGEGLIGAKYGLVSAPSPGWAVKLIGWLLLLVPALVACYIWMQGGNRSGG